MNVTVFDRQTVIGSAELIDLDPPMGVASGSFLPTDEYSADRHANVLDGEFVGDHGAKLSVRTIAGDDIVRLAVSIQDFPSLGEIVLDVMGIPAPLYEELFGENPAFRAYWGKGEV